jgi:site-specific recombinase XerD
VKSRKADPLLILVQSYFDDHLRRVRGASGHTVRAYGHALRLFFLFLGVRVRRSVADLRLDDITVDGVLAFLDDLESARRNTASTRNCRLAAIRGFVEHLLKHDVTRAAQYQRILALRGKKARARVIEYLEPEQVRAVLAQPSRRAPLGQRDYALLLLLYNTGARVGEALALSSADLHLTPPRHVRLLGKGSKERICPLWAETGAALSRIIDTSAGHQRVFRNARGDAFTRDGVAHALRKYVALAARDVPSLRRHRVTPHVLRHSCAVALLQSGVDVTVIRDYLGHASVATTSRYISTNVQMKRDVLDAFWRRAGIIRNPERRWRPTASLLTFLSSL